MGWFSKDSQQDIQKPNQFQERYEIQKITYADGSESFSVVFYDKYHFYKNGMNMRSFLTVEEARDYIKANTVVTKEVVE